mmetsp:Transcript_10797/g.12382  ORF Transcript_10797/g.12382 Transcript_10797/m.12382 type:complete len:80 (+) Transcript_10797:19-258(+)
MHMYRRQVGVQRRTMFDRPNTIIEQQKAMQKGQTPYLRGDADPTYLRKSGDSTIAIGFLAVTAASWVAIAGYHVTMWTK